MSAETPPAPLWKKALFPAFLALLIAAGIAGSVLASRNPQEHVHNWLDRLLWRSVEGYNFRLTDHHGRPVELNQFRGKVVVFSFGFTHCPNICPTMLSELAAVREKLPEDLRDSVQFLFISVDPKRDTPARLAEYVPFFDESFLGVTGSETDLKRVVYEYRASYAHGKPKDENPLDYFVDHTADVFVIAPDGQWVISYPFEELTRTDMIANDLVRFARKGK